MQDREAQRGDELAAEKFKLQDMAREQEHQFTLQQERVRADFREKQAKLEHELKMRELEVEQQLQEQALRHKLDEVQGCRGHQEVTEVTGGSGYNKTNMNRNTTIGNWLDGVWGGEHSHLARQNLACDTPAFSVPMPDGLAASGATLLTEVSLDQNTTQYVTMQAMKAQGGGSRGPSVPRDISADRGPSMPREMST